MEYKPNNVFVGLVDFFGIIVPGGMLTFLLKDELRGVAARVGVELGGEAAGWVGFVLCAYLFGQFVQLLASFMDTIYEYTYLKHRRRGYHSDVIYEKARDLAGEFVRGIGLMKWTRAYVRLKHSRASADLDRLEATSKFFRGVFVVFLCLAAEIAFKAMLRSDKWFLLLMIGGVLGLSLWLFCLERWRYTDTTYLYFIELHMYGGDKGSE